MNKYISKIGKPNTFVVKSEEFDKEAIIQQLEERKIEYPIIVKKNRCFLPKLAHAKYFISNDEGWEIMLKDEDFMTHELYIEQLMLHDEHLLIKCH
mmetsp:Transcript_17113/g.15077  ORF Transcript_17113/g.15077 Transcript_17113/m.15077 type:complete len:96 (-) Transcript_17113:340-627(-)